MIATMEQVQAFELGCAGVAALTQGELWWIPLHGAAIRLGVDVSAFCLAPDRSTVVFACSDNGLVSAVIPGSAAQSWPGVGSRVSAVAAAADGRVAAGTHDARALFGAAGLWLCDLNLEEAFNADQDLFGPEARAVGFLATGGGAAISGLGDVHMLDESLRVQAVAANLALAYEQPLTLAPLGRGLVAASERLVCALDATGTVLASYSTARGASADLRSFLCAGAIVQLGSQGQVERHLPQPEGARCVDRDGDLLVVGCADGAVHWLAAATGVELGRGLLAPCAILAIRAAHGQLVTLDARGTLTLSARGDQPNIAPLPEEFAPVRSFHLGRSAAVARWSADGQTIGVRGDQLSVHAASDGRALASWSGAGPRELWPAQGRWLACFAERLEVYDSQRFEAGGGGAIAPFSLELIADLPSGTLLSSTAGLVWVAGDGAVRAIDTGMEMRGGAMHHSLYRVAVSSAGELAVACPVSRGAILIALPSGNWLGEIQPPGGTWAFSPDATRLCDGRSGALVRAPDGKPVAMCGDPRGAAAWSADGTQLIRCDPQGAAIYGPDGELLAQVAGAAGGEPVFSPDSARIAVALASSVLLIDAATGAAIAPALATSGPVCVRFVSQTRLLAWPWARAAADPTSWLIDAANGAVLASLRIAADDALHWDCPLVWGDRLVISTPTQRPWVFSLADGQLLGRIPLAGTAELRTLAVSATGELLVLAADGEVQVF